MSSAALQKLVKKHEKVYRQRQEERKQQERDEQGSSQHQSGPKEKKASKGQKRPRTGGSNQQQSPQGSQKEKGGDDRESQPGASEHQIGKQLHDVVQHLRRVRREVTEGEIKEQVGIDLQASESVRQEVKRNEKVEVVGPGVYRYKPYVRARGKEELAAKIGDFPNGLTREMLDDAYEGVMEDVHALHQERRVILARDLSVTHRQNEVVYPREEDRFTFSVDTDIQELFRSVELPADEPELKQALCDQGLDPAPRKSKSFYRPSNDRRKRMRRQQKPRSKPVQFLQNAHVHHLLQPGAAPSSSSHT